MYHDPNTARPGPIKPTGRFRPTTTSLPHRAAARFFFVPLAIAKTYRERLGNILGFSDPWADIQSVPGTPGDPAGRSGSFDKEHDK